MKKEYVGSVKIIPLGGLDKIGMNITAIQIGRASCRERV